MIADHKMETGHIKKGGWKMISCRNLYKSFSDKTVLSGINFSIEDGEIFGLLGPSGAGKTTLINIITGQLRII